jgi:hypothetical protein
MRGGASENSVADPTTWLDVLGAVSPFLAALVAVAGVIGTIYFNNRRERDRQEHERQRQEREIEERRWSTLRDERRQVYTEFAASWNLYKESRAKHLTESQPLRRVLESDEAYLALMRSFNALSLIAPEEVRAAASGMVNREEGAPGRFWKAARKDLDIPD